VLVGVPSIEMQDTREVLVDVADVIGNRRPSARPGPPGGTVVILEGKDDTHDVGGLNLSRVRVVSGTATSGATLDNRTGAAALPSSAMLLADVLVPATDTTISNSQIRDRRKWARGAYVRITRTSGSMAVTSTTLTPIDSTNLAPRIECSGVPLRLTLRAQLSHQTAGQRIFLAPSVDLVVPESGTDVIEWRELGGVSEGSWQNFEYEWVPTAGSHILQWLWRTPAGTGNMMSAVGAPCILTVEELVRQNAKNNATTSG
jgi:hypothetical protein